MLFIYLFSFVLILFSSIQNTGFPICSSMYILFTIIMILLINFLCRFSINCSLYWVLVWWWYNCSQLTGRHEPEEAERIPTEPIQGEEKFFENIEEAARKTLERESRHENYKVTAGQVMIFQLSGSLSFRPAVISKEMVTLTQFIIVVIIIVSCNFLILLYKGGLCVFPWLIFVLISPGFFGFPTAFLPSILPTQTFIPDTLICQYSLHPPLLRSSTSYFRYLMLFDLWH